VILRPVKDHAAGVFDIKENKIFLVSKTKAIDVYDNLVLRERLDGRIAMLNVGDGKELALAPMLDTTLGKLNASALSADMSLLALSGGSRGAVWNLNSDKRLFYTRGFEGAYFDARNSLCATFPKSGETKRSIALADFVAPSFHTRNVEEDVRALQSGRYLIVKRPLKKDDYRKNVTFEVHDVCTDAMLWSRQFRQGTPELYSDRNAGSLVFLWGVADDEAKAEVRNNPQLQQRERELHEKQGVYYLELLELATGIVRSRVLVDTGKGSFVPTDAFFTKDRLFIRDNNERLLAFSLDGHLQGRVFGRGATVSPDGNDLLVYNNRGRLTIFNARTLEQRDQLDFTAPVSLLTFGADPAILTIVSSDQTLYHIDLRVLQKSTQPTQH
jgi:hypothetical protein